MLEPQKKTADEENSTQTVDDQLQADKAKTYA